MNGMMVHAQVHHPDSHSLALFDQHGSRVRPGFSVDRQPVEFHRERIGNRVVRQDRPFLEYQTAIPVRAWFIDLSGMNYYHPDHAHHLLHRHVRVIKERAVLMHGELVDKLPARQNRVLYQARHAVHFEGELDPVPVHGKDFRKVVLHDEAHAVPLIDFDQRAGHRSIEAPAVHDPPGEKLAPDNVGADVKNLDAILQGPREFFQIRHFHQWEMSRMPRRAPRLSLLRSTALLWQRLSRMMMLRPSSPQYRLGPAVT